jgi:hypothetical protein
MGKTLGQRAIESLVNSLTNDEKRKLLSEADCATSKYMQRLLKNHQECTQEIQGDFYRLPYEIYFAHAIN